MKGVSLGGSSLFPDSEIINISGLDAVGAGGLGNFSAVDLEKVLAGKKHRSITTSHSRPKTFQEVALPRILKR